MNAPSRWRPLGGWHKAATGRLERVYAAGPRARSARRAVIQQEGHVWTFEVVQFDLTTRAVKAVCARSETPYLLPDAAFKPADEAARSER